MSKGIDLNRPKLETITQVSSGWLNKYVLNYRMPDGSLYEYESVSRKDLHEYERELREASSSMREKAIPDAVCIVPILPDGSVLLIREFRYAINNWIVAFPAGLIDEGESPSDCIDRELYEEAGYRLRKDVEGAVSLLPQSGYSSVGMTDENVLVAKAFVEPAGEQHLEKGEFIELFTLKADEISEFLETNEDAIGTRCQLLLECLREDGGLFGK